MRRLSLLGGAVLALATATSAMAAAPVGANTVGANSTVTAGAHAGVAGHPAHRWTTSFTDGTTTVHGILRASVPYAGGSLTVRLAGVKRGAKVTVVLAEVVGTTTTPLMTRSMTVHTKGGHVSLTRGLSKSALQALKTLPVGATLTLTVTVDGNTTTGTFSAK